MIEVAVERVWVSAHRGKRGWCYTLEFTDRDNTNSPFRYRSRKSALAAGKKAAQRWAQN